MTQAERRTASDRRLILAGIKLIAAEGTSGATLARIGEQAGYSRGLAAERFGSKLRFLEAVVDHMEAWFQRRLTGRMQARSGLEAIHQRIGQHLDGALEATEATRALYHLYTDSLGVTPGLRPRVVALSQSFHDGFADAVRQAVAAGEITSRIAPERLASMIFAAVRGVSLQFILDGDEERLRRTKLDIIVMLDRMFRDGTA